MSRGDQDQEAGGFARDISPALLAIYGLGTVLGAGIYVVIGKIAGEAGMLTPLAFLLAAAAAALTAFSYAELSGRVPESGGSAAYVAEGFGRKYLTMFVGWALIATGLVSAATITTGFIGYANVFFPISKSWGVPALIGALTLVAAIGVRQSAWFMGLTTAAGIVGLLIVIVAAGGGIADYPARFSAGIGSQGWASGVMLASFLAFYAFIGFEDLVTLAEEAEDAQRALPLAIFVALGVSLVFYVLTSIVAVTTLDPARLDDTGAPLVAVVRETGQDGAILGLLSLAIIINGALAQLVMAARVTHDLSQRRDGAPTWLGRIDSRTRTPLRATLLGGTVIALLALFFPTETLASWTSYIILTVFFFANAALVAIKRAGRSAPEGVRTCPVIVPIGGMIVSAGLIVGELLLGGGGG